MRLTETGLPSDTRWFVGVGNQTATSSTPTITLFLRPGSYATVPGPVVGIAGHLTTERYAPGPSVEFTLSTAGVNISVPYFLQYSVKLAVTPLASGTISPSTVWADVNSTVTLTATPSPGYGFLAWYGWGPGNYSGSRNPTTFTVRAPLHERAIFAEGYSVSFVESGLATGTPWSVLLRGVPLAGVGSTVVVQEPNGTYAFQVPNVTGYTVHPVSSFVSVAGSNVTIPVTFTALRVLYSVTFTESGLPAGREWSVTIRNTTYLRTTPILVLAEFNGTYGFQVANETGFTVHPASLYFTVAGADVSMTLDFSVIPVFYPIVWEESGLPNGTRWSVTVRSEQVNSTTSDLQIPLLNGTYTYQFGNVTGYQASPPEGGITVSGSGITLGVRWTPVPPPRYTVTFSVGTLAPGLNWSVSFAGQNATSSNAVLTFFVANGTFHYGVTPPSGRYVTPGGGTVVVAGAPQIIALTLGLPSPPPPPSEWTEVGRALAVVGVLALVGLATFLVFSRRSRPNTTALTATPTSALPEYIEDSEPPLSSHVAPDYHEDALPR